MYVRIILNVDVLLLLYNHNMRELRETVSITFYLCTYIMIHSLSPIHLSYIDNPYI